MRWGHTAPDGVLGGFAGCGVYRAQEGYVALAVLEKYFWGRLRGELVIEGDERLSLEHASRARTAMRWEECALERELPLAAVRYVEQQDDTVSMWEQEAPTRGENET